MILSLVDIERLKEAYDVYDLLELLDLSIDDLIDAFDYKIIDSEEILERITR